MSKGGTRPRQFAFDLPLRPALRRADFLVSPSNEEAVAWLDRWPEWGSPGLVLTGPTGSGKTHLACVWQARAGARSVSPSTIDDTALIDLLEGEDAVILDDADAVFGDPDGERMLFHAVNHLRGHQRSFLITVTRSAPDWGIGLPDLESRLKALPHAALEPPDDQLLANILVKLFADRQLKAPSDVVDYLAVRMERSFAAANRLVAALDRRALAERRGVTIPLARAVLAEDEEGAASTV